MTQNLGWNVIPNDPESEKYIIPYDPESGYKHVIPYDPETG